MMEVSVSPVQFLPDFKFVFSFDMSMVEISPLNQSIGGRETLASARFSAFLGAVTPTLPEERAVAEEEHSG
jgi:hypothetical protein